MQNENQGSMTYEQCEAFKVSSYDAFSTGKISEAQHFIDRAEAEWHRQRHKCPFPEYLPHYVRSQLRAGSEIPPEVIQEYPPAIGTVKIAPGSTSFEPRGVPKRYLVEAERAISISRAEAECGARWEREWAERNAKTKACAVSAAAGLGMANPTIII